MGISRRFVLAGVLAAAAASLLAGPASPAQAESCPVFHVLNNDRIGPAVLPKGTYNVKLLNAGLGCANASKNFTIFLRDYDGKLGHGWKVVAEGSGKASFTYKGTPYFRVSRIGGGGGGGGGKVNVCPGSFFVQNNDRIGRLVFPRGNYKLIIPKPSIVTCAQATNLFRKFLKRPAGDLPKGWKAKSATALFFKAANPPRKKFRVDPAT